MQGHYHAVVWIDHHEARVFHFNLEAFEKNVIHPHESDKDRRREKHAGQHTADNAHFLEAVTKAVADAGAVLVTGPGTEKSELIKYIEHKHPRLRQAIEAVESADHPTDGELVAHARKVLRAEDRMRPQIA
jgi:stalled ribosome rescue protein Dom34